MAKTPVQEFRDFRTQQSSTRHNKEVAMWEQWRDAADHEKMNHLEPLLRAYEPTFQKKIQEWSRGAKAIQPAAFKAELQKHFIGALNTFNPERASLSTHVDMRLQKAKRFVVRHQNLAYIPEGQVAHIGRIQRAKDELSEELGRDPTVDEIGDHIGMAPKRVNTIMTAIRKDIPASRFESDPTASSVGREREILSLLQYNLTPEEKEVYEHLYGLNGKTQMLSTNDIARKLNKSAPQVSRLKTSILNKYNTYR